MQAPLHYLRRGAELRCYTSIVSVFEQDAGWDTRVTICASVKVRDGLVLATDSMSQVTGADASGRVEVLQTYSNARKLFQVGSLPMGVTSYGTGNVGNRSIQGLMSDFQQRGELATGVKEVTESLFDFFKVAYEVEFASLPMEQRPALGFFVAGYSEGNAFAEEWEFLFPVDPSPQPVRPENGFGSSWRGIDSPFTRLYKGFDPYIPQALRDAGLDDGVIGQVMDFVRKFESVVVYDGMPVQDAINFAAYMLRTTIGYDFFQIGPPSCGGPLQVAIILPNDGFRWVEKSEFFIDNV